MKQQNKTTHNKLSSLQLAYIAGFFDGEGSVCITKWKNHRTKSGTWQHAVYVRVAGTKPGVIRLYNQLFSPHRNLQVSRYDKPTGYHKIDSVVYSWGCAGRNALIFLKQIQPYLILKKPQAELAIAFQEKKMSDGFDRRGLKLTKEDILWREGYCLQMKALNKRNNTVAETE